MVGGAKTNVPCADIYATISQPLSTLPLRELLVQLRIALGDNFVNSLLLLAGTVMAVHYTSVIRVNCGCPCIIATGPSETGKSTAVKAALSLTGLLLNYTCRNKLYFHPFLYFH